MTWQGWLALILVALALIVGSTARPDETSKYVPMCLERKCHETEKNTVLVFSGPSNVSPSGPETLFSFGYMRRIKDDLSLGAMFMGSDRRYMGTQIGLGYHF